MGKRAKKKRLFSQKMHSVVFKENILINGKRGKKETTFLRENAFSSI